MKAKDVRVDDFVRFLKERVVQVRIMTGPDSGAIKDVTDAKIERGVLILVAK